MNAKLTPEEQKQAADLMPTALAVARKFSADDEYESLALAALVDAVLDARGKGIANLAGYVTTFIRRRMVDHSKREARYEGLDFDPQSPEPPDEFMERVRDVIRDQVGENPTKARVAEWLGLSRFALSRRIKGVRR